MGALGVQLGLAHAIIGDMVRSYVKRLSGVLVLCGTLLPSLSALHDGLHEKIGRLNQEIQANSGDARLYLKRAELLRLHQDYEAALEDLSRIRELDPGVVETNLVAARIHRDRAHHAVALKWVDRFLEAVPKHAEGLLLRAELYVHIGSYPLAVPAFDQAIAAAATPRPDLYLARARACARLGDPARAIAGIDDGLARLGSIVSLHLAAIELEVDTRQYDAALHRVHKIAEQFKRKESWLVKRGEILLLAGRDEEARNALQQAQTAIEQLQPRTRQSKQVQALEQRIARKLKQLTIQESSADRLIDSPTPN